MNKATERQINKIYNKVFKKVMSRVNMSKLFKNNYSSLRSSILDLEKSSRYERFCKQFSIELAKQGLAKEKGLWKKYFEAAKKMTVIAKSYTYKEYEKDIFEKAVKNNFKMIKSIPSEVFKVFEEKAVKAVMKQVLNGSVGRNYFLKELKKHSVKKAGVIARTESSKLDAVITEYRARNLNSVAYFWRASNDKRTRLSHREMNGVLVFWRGQEEKPLRDNMRGNAGEFPNCRCTIGPIFNEDDIKKPQYKVYNYKNDKIITMKRKDIIECLQKGEL